MKFEETKDYLCSAATLLPRQQFKSAAVVAGWGVSYVISIKGYKRMSAVCVQP